MDGNDRCPKSRRTGRDDHRPTGTGARTAALGPGPGSGVPLDVYLRTVIEQAAASEGRPEVSPDQFDAGLDALAEGSEHLPVLPPEAYRRESIYGGG